MTPTNADGVTKDAVPKPRTCSLTVTEECNLNCTYCYECYKSKKSMRFEMAKRIVEQEFATCDEFDSLTIDFMGGEPMIQFKLIQQIAEWVWSKPRPKPYTMFTTTNGTLFDEDMKQWFRRNAKRITAGLSLDGTPAMHRINRGCSLQDIDLDFFLTTWPDQQVKMTVSCETLSSLADGIIYLQEYGFKVHANLGYGMPWNDSNVGEFRRQLRILGEYYLKHPDASPVLLDQRIEFALNDDHPPKKWCGTGTAMAIYDVDGRRYPCHLFTPLCLSQQQIQGLQEFDVADDRRLEDPKCRGCSGRLLCPTCYGFNYKLTGDPAIRDPQMCRLFKAQLLENCRFQLGQLKAKANKFNQQDYRKAKAILRIHIDLVSQFPVHATTHS